MGVALTLALVCSPMWAQVSTYGDKSTGENTGDQLPTVLKGVQVRQHLNQQLPLNEPVVDGVLQLPDAVF
jgi:protein SCO1/2